MKQYIYLLREHYAIQYGWRRLHGFDSFTFWNQSLVFQIFSTLPGTNPNVRLALNRLHFVFLDVVKC